MSNQSMEWCDLCQCETLHIQPSTSHLLHLVLSVLTMGFWLPVWFIVARNNATQGKCSQCGREFGAFGSRRGGSTRGPTPETHVKCPDCAELIMKEARVCKHCGCRLIPQ